MAMDEKRDRVTVKQNLIQTARADFERPEWLLLGFSGLMIKDSLERVRYQELMTNTRYTLVFLKI